MHRSEQLSIRQIALPDDGQHRQPQLKAGAMAPVAEHDLITAIRPLADQDRLDIAPLAQDELLEPIFLSYPEATAIKPGLGLG